MCCAARTIRIRFSRRVPFCLNHVRPPASGSFACLSTSTSQSLKFVCVGSKYRTERGQQKIPSSQTLFPKYEGMVAEARDNRHKNNTRTVERMKTKLHFETLLLRGGRGCKQATGSQIVVDAARTPIFDMSFAYPLASASLVVVRAVDLFESLFEHVHRSYTSHERSISRHRFSNILSTAAANEAMELTIDFRLGYDERRNEANLHAR